MIAFLSSAGGILLKIVIAFIIFLLGLAIGKFAGIIITKLLYELQIDQILETIGVKFFFSSAAGRLVSFLIYLGGIVLALNQLRLTKIATITLGAFFAIILAIALFFGVTSAIKDLFAGLYVKKRLLGKKTIKSGAVDGKILSIGLTGIKVLTREKDVLFMPFSSLLK